MKIAVIGGTGTIGSAVVEALRRAHEVVAVGKTSGQLQVDITSRESLRAMYGDLGPLDAVLSAAGDASFGSLDELSDEDFRLGLRSKLMGQVNVVSPPWIAETLESMGRDPSAGLPAATVARAYVESVKGSRTGEVLDARDFA